MNDEYIELIKVAQLLNSVAVNGDHWMTMQACVNSILKVAESLRGDVDASNNKP